MQSNPEPQPYSPDELPEVIRRLQIRADLAQQFALTANDPSEEAGELCNAADFARAAATLSSYSRRLVEGEELRKDKERLDWIESEVLRDFHDQETGEHHLRLAHDFGWVVGGMRTAIDAARSAGEG